MSQSNSRLGDVKPEEEGNEIIEAEISLHGLKQV